MVLHLYQWEQEPYKRVVKITDADYAFMLLAGIDPVNRPYIPKWRCKCPKIGRWRCPNCFGEGIYIHGADSKELRRYLNEQV